MDKICIVCEGNMVKHPKIRGLLKCGKCGFVCADLQMTHDELKALYSEKYFKGEEYTDYVADKKIHFKNFRTKILSLQKHTGNLKEKSVFEIGCAYGFFLKVAQSFFKSAKGIDISDTAVVYANSHLTKAKAFAGDYLSMDICDKPYDVICMWDTVEHLQYPEAFIEKAAKKLKAGGYICITTGDIESLNARLRGRKWRQIHPPTHLQYFSKRTLSMLLEKYGFEIQNISYPGNWLSLKNIVYTLLVIKSNKESIWNRIKNLRILNLSFYINMHDYVYIIAQKRLN